MLAQVDAPNALGAVWLAARVAGPRRRAEQAPRRPCCARAWSSRCSTAMARPRRAAHGRWPPPAARTAPPTHGATSTSPLLPAVVQLYASAAAAPFELERVDGFDDELRPGPASGRGTTTTACCCCALACRSARPTSARQANACWRRSSRPSAATAERSPASSRRATCATAICWRCCRGSSAASTTCAPGWRSAPRPVADQLEGDFPWSAMASGGRAPRGAARGRSVGAGRELGRHLQALRPGARGPGTGWRPCCSGTSETITAVGR